MQELQVSDHERFEPCSEATGGLSYAFGYRTNLTVFFGQDSENAINLTQLVGAENDSLIAIVRHARKYRPVQG